MWLASRRHHLSLPLTLLAQPDPSLTPRAAARALPGGAAAAVAGRGGAGGGDPGGGRAAPRPQKATTCPAATPACCCRSAAVARLPAPLAWCLVNPRQHPCASSPPHASAACLINHPRLPLSAAPGRAAGPLRRHLAPAAGGGCPAPHAGRPSCLLQVGGGCWPGGWHAGVAGVWANVRRVPVPSQHGTARCGAEGIAGAGPPQGVACPIPSPPPPLHMQSAVRCGAGTGGAAG